MIISEIGIKIGTTATPAKQGGNDETQRTTKRLFEHTENTHERQRTTST